MAAVGLHQADAPGRATGTVSRPPDTAPRWPSCSSPTATGSAAIRPGRASSSAASSSPAAIRRWPRSRCLRPRSCRCCSTASAPRRRRRPRRPTSMLIRLFRPTCCPYRKLLLAVSALQFVQMMCTLTLPTLNADIIDKGILTGNTGYIWRIGARHARRHPRAGRVRHRGHVLRRQGGHGASAATCAAACSTGSPASRPRRSATSAPRRSSPASPTTCTQVQMLVVMIVHAVRRRADHDRRRHHPGRPRGRPALAASCVVSHPRCSSSASGW